jgi:hypothetical protein
MRAGVRAPAELWAVITTSSASSALTGSICWTESTQKRIRALDELKVHSLQLYRMQNATHFRARAPELPSSRLLIGIALLGRTDGTTDMVKPWRVVVGGCAGVLHSPKRAHVPLL